MVRLGKTELFVSEIGLGADHFGTAVSEQEATRILDAYLAAGGNFIDTANIYGKWVAGAGNASERFLGKWRKTHPEAIIATKGGHYTFDAPDRMRLSRQEIEVDLDESLLTLGVDTIDLYYLHRDDTEREIGEILDTMEDFVKAGKIRYYGASNYTAKRLFEADAYAEKKGIVGFSAVSNRYSALCENPLPFGDPTLVSVGREELLFHCHSGLPLVPYQATARGYFTKLVEGRLSDGLIKQYQNEKNEALYRELCAFCEENACSLQTATLVRTATAPFQIVPLTSVRAAEQVRDIEDAMRLLSEFIGDTV